MQRQLRYPLSAAALLGCVLLCSSCTWFQPRRELALNVEYSEDTNSIVLSVSGAPEQGVAGLFLEEGALQFDTDKILLTGMHGSNDFTILSYHFDNVDGGATVVAVNPTKGIRNGVIATISFLQVDEGDPGIDLDPDSISLVDSYNMELGGFELRTNQNFLTQ